MRTIVVGYDGTGESERALARAAELARALTARLIVVSVGRVQLVITADSVLPAGATGVPVPIEPRPVPPQPDEPDEAAILRDRARGLLAQHDVDVEYVSELGDPAERLLEVADEREADMIVVGSRERSFIERLLGGAIDEKLARKAHRDVLLVH
jgi:nucleotide-binding universal stress UspA family protein